MAQFCPIILHFTNNLEKIIRIHMKIFFYVYHIKSCQIKITLS